MKYALIIPTYNDWTRVKLLLESIKSQLNSDLASKWLIVVVDNASDDNWLEVRDKYDFVSWEYCSQPGSYAARNIGIESIKADVYCFTDSDCIIGDNYFSSVEKAMTCGRELIAGSIKMYTKDRSKINIFESYDCILGLPQKKYASRGYGITANLVVSSKVFNKIGIFDSNYYSGGDHEFCSRCRRNGIMVVYDDRIQVMHPCRQSLTEFENKINRVIGAQLSRRGNIRKFMLLFRLLMVPMKMMYLIVLSEQQLKIKISALVSNLIIGFIRIKFYFLHIFNSIDAQR